MQIPPAGAVLATALHGYRPSCRSTRSQPHSDCLDRVCPGLAGAARRDCAPPSLYSTPSGDPGYAGLCCNCQKLGRSHPNRSGCRISGYRPAIALLRIGNVLRRASGFRPHSGGHQVRKKAQATIDHRGTCRRSRWNSGIGECWDCGNGCSSLDDHSLSSSSSCGLFRRPCRGGLRYRFERNRQSSGV